ncbi:acyl carrier protein [Desulfosporosinus youngiae]|uniref:Phosphopantetheine-containing protein n=1 Tax=Desulfosporosinus youngiae DSM 17734 TaxID=768710 RepID=H5XU19_9FIRM|nr:acyl carrier protein [Desulfosporosinus youngiae]EHQ88977.1 phosphopantetheine-containing protein [Desulfosporosinus youngiae DSM 17734]
MMSSEVALISSILRKNIVELETMDIQPEMPLISSGFIDSFDVIEILSHIEEAFHIIIPLETVSIEDFDTVISMAELVLKLKEAC